MPQNMFDQFVDDEEDKKKKPNMFDQFVRERSARAAPPQTSQGSTGGSWVESALSGAADGFSLGWGDEILGGLAAAGDTVGLSGLWGGMTGDQVGAWSRAQQQVAAKENPLAYGIGQIGGSIGGGFGLGGVARLGLGAAGLAAGAGSAAAGMGAGGRIAAAALTGAAGGAAYGAGSADWDNKIGGGAEGALWGAALGGGLRAVGEPLGQFYRSTLKPAFDANYRGARMMSKKFDMMGGTPQELMDDMRMAPRNAVAMDVLPGGPQIAMGAGTRPSKMKDTFRKQLDARNNQMGDDAADDAWNSILTKKDRIDAGRRILDIKEAKRAINYDDIDAQPGINVTDNQNRKAIDFIVHHTKKNGRFKGAIDDALERTRLGDPRENGFGLRQIGDEQWDIHMFETPKFWRTLWTNVREEMDDLRRQVRVSGTGRQQLRDFQNDASALRKEVGRMLGPEWEKKQSIYRALSQEEEALRFGYDAVDQAGDIKLGDFLDDLNQSRNRVAPSQRDQFDKWVKQGALAKVEDMMNKADTQSGRADVLRSIIGNKAKVTTLNNILGQVTAGGKVDMRTSFAKVLKRLEAQRELFQNSVESGIGVNSHTADKLAAMASQQAMTQPSAGGLRGMLMRGITGDSIDAFDENVSNKVLSLLGEPVKSYDGRGRLTGGLFKRINDAGGVEAYMKNAGKDDLLALALKSQTAEWRKKALAEAMLGGLYSNVGGDALAGVALGQT